MPVPSACSKNIFTAFKFFCTCSIFFEHSQIFWSWSKARFYLINLHIWAWSKIFEHIQKILNTVKNFWTSAKNIWTSRWIRHKIKNPFLNLKKSFCFEFLWIPSNAGMQNWKGPFLVWFNLMNYQCVRLFHSLATLKTKFWEYVICI